MSICFSKGSVIVTKMHFPTNGQNNTQLTDSNCRESNHKSYGEHHDLTVFGFFHVGRGGSKNANLEEVFFKSHMETDSNQASSKCLFVLLGMINDGNFPHKK